jgi:phytoene dehydrogenase-like protein
MTATPPEVIRDLGLAAHGLRMVPREPSLQVPFLDGTVLPWWPERSRTVAELERISPADARAFVAVDDRWRYEEGWPVARIREPVLFPGPTGRCPTPRPARPKSACYYTGCRRLFRDGTLVREKAWDEAIPRDHP